MQKEEPKILLVVGTGPIEKHLHEVIEQHKQMGYEIQYTDKMPPPKSETKPFIIKPTPSMEEVRIGIDFSKNQKRRYNRNKYRKP